MLKTEVPVEACRFAADLTVGTVAGESKNVPFTALARTGNAVDHWYWGRTVHDFAGMQSAATFPVDYRHDDAEALGVVSKTEITQAGLMCTGQLVPFEPGDRASEIIHKSKNGVPYQASIYFDPWSCVVEDVPAGFSAEANGQTFEGPVAIFRQWKMLGLAFCLYGVDDETSVGFSKKSGKTVAVTRFSKGTEMADTTTETAATTTDSTDTTTEEPVVEKTQEELDADAAAAAAAAVSAVADVITTAAVAAAPAVVPTELSRKQEADKFVTEFGKEHGPAMFAAGYSLAQARAQFSKIQTEEIASLKAQIGKLSKPAAGGAQAASFGGVGNKAVPSKFAHLGDRIARFANGVKLPK